jgi:hypothetical protein
MQRRVLRKGLWLEFQHFESRFGAELLVVTTNRVSGIGREPLPIS